MSSVLSRGALWRVVAEREIAVKIRDKTYLWSTAALVIGVLAAFVATSFFGGRSTTYDVATVDSASESVITGADDLIAGDDAVESSAYDSVDEAEQAVTDGDVDAALVPTADGYELVGDSSVDDELSTAVSSAAYQVGLQANAEQAGVSVDRLLAGTTVGERTLDPDSDQAGARILVATGFAIVFLMSAMTFGLTIANSVVQEKESRVVEILAAAIPIRSMLWGKIIGNTILGVAQIVVVVIAGLIGMVATGRDELLSAVGPAAAWYVVFFLLGFTALAGGWSVAGSMASRTEDVNSTSLPVQLLLFGPYFASVFAGPEIERWLSFVPIVSTMIMPGRMAKESVPLWEVGLSIALTVAATALVVRLAERVYERTLLQTSRKLSYREALALKD